MRYDSVANDVAEQTGVPVETIRLIYKKLFLYMREKLHTIDIDDIHSKEDLIRMKYSFNLQHLGKLYLNYNTIQKYRKYRDESIGDTTDV